MSINLKQQFRNSMQTRVALIPVIALVVSVKPVSSGRGGCKRDGRWHLKFELEILFLEVLHQQNVNVRHVHCHCIGPLA